MSSEPSRVAHVVPTQLDRRVLAALPRYTGASEWPTLAEISERAGVPADVARSCLVGLRGHHLVEGDETFARTKRGDVALERGEVSDSPDSYTRFGPSDKAGQPCVECGRPAPPPTPAPDGAAGQGWLHEEDDNGFGWNFLCPDCKTPENIARWHRWAPTDGPD